MFLWVTNNVDSAEECPSTSGVALQLRDAITIRTPEISGDSNENGKNRSRRQNNNFAPAHCFYISFPFIHDYDRKLPYLQGTTNFFSFWIANVCSVAPRWHAENPILFPCLATFSDFF